MSGLNHRVWGMVCLLSLFSAAGAQAQSAGPQVSQAAAEPEAPRVVLPAESAASVLRLMKFSGVLRDRAGNPRSGTQGLTFALYKDQQGGTPLWLEVQNVELDEQGRYTALLGSTKSEGLPLELFSTGEARWLGIQGHLPGEEEQRVLLVSVPYALKAADADTLGGKPVSAFVLTSANRGTVAEPNKGDQPNEGDRPQARYAPAAHNHDAAYVNVSGDTMAGTLNLPANGRAAPLNWCSRAATWALGRRRRAKS